jgi:hypothetical protein
MKRMPLSSWIAIAVFVLIVLLAIAFLVNQLYLFYHPVYM